MAPYVHRLNAYASQQLVSLFDMLSRKYVTSFTVLSLTSYYLYSAWIMHQFQVSILFVVLNTSTFRYNKLAEVSNGKKNVKDDVLRDDNFLEDPVGLSAFLHYHLSYSICLFGSSRHLLILIFNTAVSGTAYIYWLPETCAGDTKCNPILWFATKSWGMQNALTSEFLISWMHHILTFCDNFQVVYAIMHRQEVLLPFKNHPRFSELLENIYTVCVQLKIYQFCW